MRLDSPVDPVRLHSQSNCKLCEKTFESGTDLFDHLFTEHMSIELQCSNCPFIGSTPKSLLDHQTRVHAYLREMCGTCGKLVRNYHQHKLIHYQDKQRFLCNTCPKKFYSDRDLKYHLLVHTGEKPYACTSCEKRFATPGNLKQHLVVHEPAKAAKLTPTYYVDDDYKCVLCKAHFTGYEPFKDHVFAMHVPQGDQEVSFLGPLLIVVHLLNTLY